MVTHSISAGAVVPAVATLFFVMAAIAGLLAWSGSRSQEPHRLTYWDVAGALVFIGICMAALVQPDQLVSLLATGPRG